MNLPGRWQSAKSISQTHNTPSLAIENARQADRCQESSRGPARAVQVAGINEATFYAWIARGEKAKSGLFREFHESLKWAERTSNWSTQPRPGRHGAEKRSPPSAFEAAARPASKFILNSTVLDRGARRDRTHREVTRRVRQQTGETPVDDAILFFELGPKRQTHARHAVLAITECHVQVAADRSRLEELFEFFEMRGTFRRFTYSLVAGDVLRFLSKKNDVWFPKLKTRPRHGDRKGEPYIMGKVLPSQRLLKQFEEQLVFGEMNLSEIVRSGAQMMLQYALECEVTEALGRNYYENAPATTKEKGRRNGYESHRVLTGEGAVTVQVPRVRETEKVFQSKILDAYVSRTEKLDELIARMYVHGMSTRDIEATFADVLSGTGVSKSVVSRVTRCLSEDFEAFRKRDLSNEKLLYLELDGTYLRYHQGAERKEPILVATGYRADGTRVLLHIGVGNRESYENWKGFLQEMVARGMREPLLIVTDGNPGVLKAIAEVFPRSLKQRCQKHRLENILGQGSEGSARRTQGGHP